MTILDEVRKAAKAEHNAEQSREKHQASFQTAWWRLTTALAKPTREAEVKAAFDAAREELGTVSSSWLTQRRRTGKVILALECQDQVLRTLPPRLAVAWVCDLKRDATGMLEALSKAKMDELSLRAFIAEHGGVPMSTSKERFTPQQRDDEPVPSNGHAPYTPPYSPPPTPSRTPYAPPYTPPPAPPRPPAIAAREALDDPAVRQEVVKRMAEDGDAVVAVNRARREVVANTVPANSIKPLTPEQQAAQAAGGQFRELIVSSLELSKQIQAARTALLKAATIWQEIGGDANPDRRDDLVEVLDSVTNISTLLAETIKKGSTMSDEADEFLKSMGGSE